MDFWNRTDFNLTAHSTCDIAIINGADEITTALEDSMVTLANVKSSRFVTPVKVLVNPDSLYHSVTFYAIIT